ncbi:MAG TPA: hypothetical protein PLO98_11400, partial [Bacteroidia bacterium]|nr:hypothetical protein [Bacteroidia bacterium]
YRSKQKNAIEPLDALNQNNFYLQNSNWNSIGFITKFCASILIEYMINPLAHPDNYRGAPVGVL